MDIRAEVPHDLASWLDAYSVEGEADFGRPGFERLRLAWVGRIPAADIADELTAWVPAQRGHQAAAQSAYEALMASEPVGRADDGLPVIPPWFGFSWAEVLLSHPWDERLGGAVQQANEYLTGVDA